MGRGEDTLLPSGGDETSKTRSLAALAFPIAPAASAEVERLELTRWEAVAEGRSFGLAGPYEKLVGRVPLALDLGIPLEDSGDGFLRRDFTLAWVGWQSDVPGKAGEVGEAVASSPRRK